MAYTASQLLMDILPRVGNLPTHGVTFFGAANSVSSLIFKRLLKKRSDLLATGELYAIIPALGYKIILPADFLSPAEKPSVTTIEDLIVNLTNQLITDGLTVPNQATLAAMFANGVGANVTDIQALVSGQIAPPMTDNISASIYGFMDDDSRRMHLSPAYLDDENEHHDLGWWDWFGISGDIDSGHRHHSHTMKIINTNMFIRPKSEYAVVLKGKYYQKPVQLVLPTDIIPFNSLFDEVYREGVVRIVGTGIAMPMTDPAFNMFVSDEIDSILDSRAYIAPARRMKRSNYI